MLAGPLVDELEPPEPLFVPEVVTGAGVGTVAMVVPVSINGVGVREGGLALMLKPAGVSTDAAVAIGLLWFLTTICCGLVGGVLFLLDRNPRYTTKPTSTTSS